MISEMAILVMLDLIDRAKLLKAAALVMYVSNDISMYLYMSFYASRPCYAPPNHTGNEMK